MTTQSPGTAPLATAGRGPPSHLGGIIRTGGGCGSRTDALSSRASRTLCSSCAATERASSCCRSAA
jgi:hypothetical protein